MREKRKRFCQHEPFKDNIKRNLSFLFLFSVPRKKKRSKCLHLSSLSLQALQNWAARERWAAKMSSRSPHMAFYQSNYLILFCSIKNWFFIKLSYLTCSQKVLLCLTFNEVLSSLYSHGSDFSTLRRHIFVFVFANYTTNVRLQHLNRIMKKSCFSWLYFTFLRNPTVRQSIFINAIKITKSKIVNRKNLF